MDALGWIAERLALFLSIQAQDFIEERANAYADAAPQIPEHSSSGFH